MTDRKICTSIKGAIGEFYVASFLSAMGLVVALPRSGVPSSDLLVTTFEGHKTLSLQVKTSLWPMTKSNKWENYWSWHVSNKARECCGDNFWYVFVNAYNWPDSGNQPDIYFVPSKIVAETVADWNDPGSSTQFFRIKQKGDREQFLGVEGFKKMQECLMYPYSNKGHYTALGTKS
jgi:hypothetical protein